MLTKSISTERIILKLQTFDGIYIHVFILNYIITIIIRGYIYILFYIYIRDFEYL